MAARSARTARLAALILLAPGVRGGESWPEYRGPAANGCSDALGLPRRWSETENIRWKAAIHDRGWSSPVVLGDQVWVTTAAADGKRMYAVCADRESGRILHDRKLFDVEDPRPLGNPLNCYASPSPVIEPGRVYVHFGSYGTACLDTRSGDVLWQRRDLPCDHFRGPASSPIISHHLLVFHMDGADQQYVVALDKATGRTVWRTDRSTEYGDLEADGKPRGGGDFRKAFNTPVVVRAGGRDLLVSPAAKAVYGYEPLTGTEVWQVRYGGHSTASRTLYHEGLALVNTGWPRAELWAVRVDGRGDVTETHVAWKRRRSVPNRSSPVLVGGLVFMCTDEGIASCLEAATGEEVWLERIGGEYSASPVAAEGRVYFFSQEGKTTVIRAGGSFEVLEVNQLDDGFMASPAVAGKAFFLRTKTHLYRVEGPPG